MKALSIKQPWASLIAHDIKNIENRNWKTKFRGKIYIHASGTPAVKSGKTWTIYTKEQLDEIHLKHDHLVLKAEFETSMIIGEVEIVDCVINHDSIWAEKTTIHIENGKMYSNEKPIYNWVLANAVLYDKPILNVKGKLSFWEPDIDILECIGCSQKFDSEFMEEDDAGEKYCQPCWDELSPIFHNEYEEMKPKGEID